MPSFRIGTYLSWVWVLLGFVALAIGALGAILPILPTTPFILLAAFAFGRGSPRLYGWLTNNRRLGPVIHSWQTNGAIALRHKLIALVTMVLVLAASFAFAVPNYVLGIQAVCMCAASAFIVTRPNS